MGDLVPGVFIALPDGRHATIRFIGETHFAPGEWVGIELDEPTGKNDGAVQGERYFDCEPRYGMFIRPSAVTAILGQRQPPAAPPTPQPPAQRVSPAAGTGAGTASHSKRASERLGSRMKSAQSVSGIPATNIGTARRTTPTVRRPNSISSLTSPTKTAPKPTGQAPPATPSSSARTSRPSITPRSGMPTPSSSTSSLAAPSSRLTKQPSASALGSKAPPRRPSLARPTIGSGAQTKRTPHTTRTPGSSSVTSDEVQSSSEKERDSSPGPTTPARGGLRGRPSPSSTQRISANAGAISKELEDLRTKLKMLEKKRAEDREKLKDIDNIRADKEKYESIIQKLQAKYQPQALELTTLRKTVKELEAKLEEAERLQAEHDSILEMATLDREMAEETAEAIKMEFEAIKLKAEELGLEVEVLREENAELSSSMSPEERSSAGWLQMEKTNERLREALIRLRDMTQQQESELKKQIEELEADLEDYSAMKSDYETTKEQLRASEANMEDLKQQVEALGAEDMIEELTEKNMQYQEQATELKAVIDDLESLRELNDELELNHVETEKQMQEEIDFLERLQSEQRRKISQQNETISDLEYTLNRFRELVTTLQNDLEDMRVTQQLTESEANDLTVRSRAMIDLNMKLQASMSKAQTKTIDVELGRMEAEESAEHLEIMKLYLPEYYETERNPIMAFLRFKRVEFKASLANTTIKERMTDSTVTLSNQDVFLSYDLLEKLTLISSLCGRFADFMRSCSADEFLKFEGAWYELEPVERNLNHYIDGLRKNELNEQTCAVELQRSIALLLHLSETLIPPTVQSHADDIIIRTIMMQAYLDDAASALSHLRKNMADKMKTEEGDEEGPFLLQKLEAFAEQARGGKVVAGRSTRALDELKSRSLTLPKECSELFAKTEEATKAMAGLARDLGMRIIDILEDPERTEPPTPSMIADYMAEVIAGCFPPPVANEDTVSYIAKRLQTIGGYLEDVSTVASDLSQTVEFERRDPPWVGRAQELKSNKVVPPDADEEIKRLRNAIHEASTALGVKDKSIEEQTIKIELLESRMRDQTKKAETLEKVQAELETAKAERQELVEITEKQSNDLKLLEQEREESKARLEKAKRTSVSTGALSGGAVPVSDVASSELLRENEYLRSEVASLQSAVRYLREENRRANLMDPWAVQRSNHVRSWLNAPLVKTHPKQPQEDGVEPTVTPTEAQDVLAHLLRLTKEASVVDLKKTVPADSSSRLAWRSFKTTPRYHTLKQRDEYEEWCSWKDDVARREREKQRRDALRLKKRAEKKEPPTLFQVYSNAHLSGMPEKEGKENAPTRPESQGKGMVNRAFKILEKIHKHEGDEEANPQGQDQVDVVEA